VGGPDTAPLGQEISRFYLGYCTVSLRKRLRCGGGRWCEELLVRRSFTPWRATIAADEVALKLRSGPPSRHSGCGTPARCQADQRAAPHGLPRPLGLWRSCNSRGSTEGRAPTRLAWRPAPWPNTRHSWVGRCRSLPSVTLTPFDPDAIASSAIVNIWRQKSKQTLSSVQEKADGFCRSDCATTFKRLGVIAHYLSYVQRYCALIRLTSSYLFHSA